MKYFLYCRKSTEAEDRQVLSIESQKAEMHRFAQSVPDLEIVETIVDAMSAQHPGRPGFNRMMKEIKRGKAQGIIAWAPNRLSRNWVDAGVIFDLLDNGVIKDLRFATFSFENSPQGKFMLGILFAESKHYSDSLSQHVRRGFRMKFEKGWLPAIAKLGYLNSKEGDPIIPDPERFELCRRMWGLMLTGTHSPRRIWEVATREWGLTTPKRKKIGGKPITLSAVYKMFINPFYAGVLQYEGVIREGKHKPMVTVSEFERVQELLGRPHRPRPKKLDFPYTGLMRCGECGFAVTAEEKVNKYGSRYTYYHCSRRRLDYRCRQGYVQVGELERQIVEFLKEIEIPSPIEKWISNRLQADTLRKRDTEKAIQISAGKRLKTLQRERDNLIGMRRRELISDDEYASQRAAIDSEEIGLKQHQEQLERGGNWFELARSLVSFNNRAADYFSRASDDKRRLVLSVCGSNSILKDKKLLIEAKKPFRKWVRDGPNLDKRRAFQDVRTFCEDPANAETINLITQIVGTEESGIKLAVGRRKFGRVN